jgi:ubiquinone/menaquinone biosynthesis C-methylase UbiE
MGAVRDFELDGWQAAASSYDAFAGATRLFIPSLLCAAGARPGTRLLDVACGTGLAAGAAAAAGARASGVDFSPAMLDIARRSHPTVAFHTGDAEQLPFVDASFDAVVANFGIHHVERPERAFAEARRVLEPSGAFAFTFWSGPQDNTAWRIIFDAIAAHGRSDVPMPAGNDAHATPENFSRLLTAAGFDARTLCCELLEKTWHLPGDADLVSIFETGTVRMATLLRGQRADALAAIRRSVAKQLQSYLHAEAIALPTRAWLIAAKAA